jgi:hypothetical protein
MKLEISTRLRLVTLYDPTVEAKGIMASSRTCSLTLKLVPSHLKKVSLVSRLRQYAAVHLPGSPLQMTVADMTREIARVRAGDAAAEERMVGPLSKLHSVDPP